MKRKALAAVVFLPVALSAQGVAVSGGIEYGRGVTRRGAKALLLDIYRPAAACSTLKPLVVLIHGGAFRRGSRDEPPWPGFAADLAAAGYVAASIGYRLHGDQPVPSQPFVEMGRIPAAAGLLGRDALPNGDSRRPRKSRSRGGIGVRAAVAVSALEDAAKAVNWLRDNAADYCIDSEKIALWGGSAGAIMALHTAYALDDYAIPAPAVRAVVDLWGGLLVDAHLETGEAPLFIVHGVEDTVVPYKETLEIAARARQVGVPVEVHAIEGAGHGFADIGIRARQVDGISLFDRIRGFLDRELKGAAEDSGSGVAGSGAEEASAPYAFATADADGNGSVSPREFAKLPRPPAHDLPPSLPAGRPQRQRLAGGA